MNKYILYIPRGCGHGFAALSEDVELIYRVDNLYSSENENGIIWNDPTININWPINNPIISNKDEKWQKFRELFL